MIVTSEQKSENKPLSESTPLQAPADNEVTEPRKRNGRSSRRLLWSIITLIIFAILTVAVWYWWEDLKPLMTFVTDQEAFGAYLQSFGILGPLVLWIAQLLQVFFAFIPGHVVLIAAAYVYGFPLGLFFNITFTVAASQLAYLFARWAGRPLVYRFVDKETIEYWERVANQKGVIFFTISFLLPIFPSDAMNFVAGLSGIDSRRFLIANFTGRFPSAVMLSLIGAYGFELSTPVWAAFIVAYILFFFVGHYIVNKIRQTVDQEEQVKTSQIQEPDTQKVPQDLGTIPSSSRLPPTNYKDTGI